MSANLRDHLLAIRDQHGALTPVLIVEAASDPEHPLHSRFDWDDTSAGHKYRLEQAGTLLRVVPLPKSPSQPHDLRAFVAVKGKDSHRADYIPTETAMADDFTRRLVLADMEREWKSLKRRYQHMAEFAQLVLTDIQEEVA